MYSINVRARQGERERNPAIIYQTVVKKLVIIVFNAERYHFFCYFPQ